MKSRQLGSAGFNVSEISLGCWQLGADWGKSINKKSSFSILQEAVNNGVTFFDTADVYGNGRSESIIGEFLKTTDKKIKVATKFGRAGETYPNNYTKDVLRSSIEASLERLKVNSLDLVQLHCIPTEELRKGDVFEWLRELKNEGLIKHFGASVESVEEGLLCMQQEELLSLQVIFNIFRQKLTTELLPQAQEKGVGIIVRLPLASGLLSGKFNKNTTFLENDHRNYNKNGDAFNVGETFAGLPFETGIELVEEIKNNMLTTKATMAQFAQRWILDHQAVSCIIPGASSPKQIEMNAAVSELDSLSDETHNKLFKFYTENVAQAIRGPY